MAKPKPKREDDPSGWDSSVLTNIITIKGILDTRILDKYHSGDNNAQTLAMCAFTQLMICLKDLLAKASNEGQRLDRKVSNELDITDLVVKIRDAACHVDSKDNFLGKSKFIFRMETLPNGDVTYGYGEHYIYLNGSIIPVFNDVKERLIPLMDNPPDSFT